MSRFKLSVGRCAATACLFEALAAKPGNVHRGSDFEDLTFADFALSAQAIGPVFETAHATRLGPLVRQAIQATRAVVNTNTNLGMVLLLAPLAMVPPHEPLAAGINHVLSDLNEDDCRLVYEAIRLANPGGMSRAAEADIQQPPPANLLAAMQLAADRDLVARQYTNGFAEVFSQVTPALQAGIDCGWSLSSAIIHAHVRTMAALPDTLIARKCGQALADESAAYARAVLRAGQPGDENYHAALADLDFWLREDGHRRNPGTTADLIAAGLFVLLRNGIIELPVKFYS